MNTYKFECVLCKFENEKIQILCKQQNFRDAHNRHKKAPDCGISIAT